MKYKVHHFKFKTTKDKDRLEDFLNDLDGEIIAIIPSVQPKFVLMGISAATESLLVVEKIKKWGSS